MLVVNLYGEERCSEAAAFIYSQLRMKGINAGILLKPYEEEEVYYDPVLNFSKQSARLDRIRNKFDVVVTNAPLLSFYNDGMRYGSGFQDLIEKAVDNYENLDVFISKFVNDKSCDPSAVIENIYIKGDEEGYLSAVTCILTRVSAKSAPSESSTSGRNNTTLDSKSLKPIILSLGALGQDHGITAEVKKGPNDGQIIVKIDSDSINQILVTDLNTIDYITSALNYVSNVRIQYKDHSYQATDVRRYDDYNGAYYTILANKLI